MFKKNKIILIIVSALLILFILHFWIKSVKEYRNEKECDCMDLFQEYDLNMQGNYTCSLSKDILGQIKSYRIEKDGDVFFLVKDMEDTKDYYFKKKLMLIDSMQDMYKDYEMTIEFYTYKNADTDQYMDIFYIIHLEKDNYVLYGGVQRTEGILSEAFKNTIQDEIRLSLDEMFYD